MPVDGSGKPAERVQGPLQKAGWLLRMVLLQTLWWVVRPMQVDRASATGSRVLGWLGPRLGKHRHVLANLRLAFPEKSPREIERLGRDIWANCGAVIAEFGFLDKLVDPGGGAPRIEILRADVENGAEAGRRPRIYVGAHLANWELLAYAASRASGSLDVIYNPQPFAMFDRMVQKKRAPLGCGFVSKENAVRKLCRILQAGGSVGMLVDLRMEGGGMLPFFGVEATVTTAPAWLALKTGAQIVPIRVERRHEANFRITLQRPLDTAPLGTESRDRAIERITAEINAIVESWIRERPGEWLCTQRRWPKARMKQLGVYPEG